MTTRCGECDEKSPQFTCDREADHRGPHQFVMGLGTVHQWENPNDRLNNPLPLPEPVHDSARSGQAPQVTDFHGIKSTKLPQFNLLPKAALIALANRMELGIKRKGPDAVWKPQGETSADFVIERLSHVIHHCYDAIAKIKRGEPLTGEEDAGAILFGGAVLAVFKENCQNVIDSSHR